MVFGLEVIYDVLWVSIVVENIDHPVKISLEKERPQFFVGFFLSEKLPGWADSVGFPDGSTF